MKAAKHDSAAAARLAWASAACQERGLRRTAAREKILGFLARHDHPVTLATVTGDPGVAETCDPATVFRVLQKLEEAGLARRIWLHERTPFYVLVTPHGHRDYVLCTQCGRVEATGLDCPVQALEKEVGARLGYAGLRHELGFYGLCPDCQGAAGKAGTKPRKAVRVRTCC